MLISRQHPCPNCVIIRQEKGFIFAETNFDVADPALDKILITSIDFIDETYIVPYKVLYVHSKAIYVSPLCFVIDS
jgi:hypothetical protein